MITSHTREKLINAIVYFAANTRKCGKTKLFKLLYFLDFEHFRATGRSVTGLEYYAWPMGPVPRSLNKEVKKPDPDFAEKVSVRKVRTLRGGRPMELIEPKVAFDPSHFSKREMQLLKRLCAEYEHSLASEMVEKSHLETLPWHRVFQVERRSKALIPYDYALRKGEEDMVRFMAAENQEMLDNYK